jgi:hypothetical protein
LEASCLLYDAFVEDASNRRAAVWTFIGPACCVNELELEYVCIYCIFLWHMGNV